MRNKITKPFIGFLLFIVLASGFGIVTPVYGADDDNDVEFTTTRSSRSSSFGGRISSSIRTKINKLDDDIVKDLTIPILIGVSPQNISDTWGDARSNGRTHEGIDIFAPRGMYVISPTEGVVTSTGFGSNGGNYVFAAAPGGETYYYAHLDRIEEGVKSGTVLERGDIIGYVGNTGNASGGATHLHFGIYAGREGAINPFPRLTEEFFLKERIEILTDIVNKLIEQLKDMEK